MIEVGDYILYTQKIKVTDIVETTTGRVINCRDDDTYGIPESEIDETPHGFTMSDD